MKSKNRIYCHHYLPWNYILLWVD